MSKPNRPKAATPSFLTGEQRINKLLAAAGFGSRRQVDELITDGRVEIDGKLVTQVGVKVDADVAKVTVDGEPLKRHRPVYFAVHKPEGFLCTNCDPDGRPRVIELVPSTARLFPVGRLDASSTGLILLTNDGELAQRLAHPKHCVPKTYFVVVAGQVDYDSMRRLQRGIYLAEGVARVDGATIRKVRKGCTEIDITLSEGKNREIRRVLARLGHKVVVLRRVAIGPLKLADMPEGSYRPLQDKEVAALYNAVDEIKRARNLERRERKKRNTVDGLAMSDGPNGDPANSASSANGSGNRPSRPRKAVAIFDEEGDNWDDADDEMMDVLPPISANPFRTEDDEDASEDEAFDDAILVTETDGQIFSNRKGSVLAFDDDEINVEAIADDFEPHKVKRNANRDRSPRASSGADRPAGARRTSSRPSGNRFGGNRPMGERAEGARSDGDRPRGPRIGDRRGGAGRSSDASGPARGARRTSAPLTDGADHGERPTRGRRPSGTAIGYGRSPAGSRTSSQGSRPQRSGGGRSGDTGAAAGGVETGADSAPARGRMRRTGSFTGNSPRTTEGSERPRNSSARTGGPRSSSNERSSGSRTTAPRAGGSSRSSAGRSSGAGARSGGAGARSGGAGARSGAARSSAPRAGGARPSSAGRPRRGGKPGNRGR